MSEKPKNLRQYLSKTKVSQQKEIVEPQEEIPDNKENIENNKDKDNDIDPLKFFEQPKEINPQISFLDLLANAMDEKKIKEEEELKKKKDNEDENEQVSIIARVQSKKKQAEKKEDNKEKKKEETKEPTRLLGSLNKKIDENELLKQLENEKLNDELRDEPQKLENLDLPELDEKKKKRLMARMTSAKQGVNKLTLGKALLKIASAGLMEKQGKTDDQTFKQFHQIVSTDLKNTFVLNDSDVQRVNENEPIKGNIEVKNVDFNVFMKPKNQEGQNEKRSLKDMILGKKKAQPQTQQPTEQQPK